MSRAKKIWQHKDKPGVLFNGTYKEQSSHTHWVGKKFELTPKKGTLRAPILFDSWQHAVRQGWKTVN